MQSAGGLIFIQLKLCPQAVRIVIEQGKEHANRDVAQAVNDHQRGNLSLRGEHVLKLFPGHRQAIGESAHHQREKKLQWIDVKQNDKEQYRVQNDHIGGLHAVTPRINVMVVPDLDQHGKADGEGDKSL